MIHHSWPKLNTVKFEWFYIFLFSQFYFKTFLGDGQFCASTNNGFQSIIHCFLGFFFPFFWRGRIFAFFVIAKSAKLIPARNVNLFIGRIQNIYLCIIVFLLWLRLYHNVVCCAPFLPIMCVYFAHTLLSYKWEVEAAI